MEPEPWLRLSDLRGPRASPLSINRWWFLTSGVLACRWVVPLQDSSVAHSCVPG